MTRRAWTAAEIALLSELRGRGVPYRQIAAEVGHSENCCTVMLHYQRQGRTRTPKGGRRAVMNRVSSAVQLGSRAPSPEALAQRVALAAALQQRGITAVCMGDPPPGRSALDQRRGGAQR